MTSPEQHTYTISHGPKMLQEALCTAQYLIRSSGNVGTRQSYSDILQELIHECERKRPTGSNGKHGKMHTDECGCDDKEPRDQWEPVPSVDVVNGLRGL